MISDEKIAARVSELFVEFSRRIDQSIALVKETASPEEFSAYRRAAGRVLGEMLLEVMNPLYQKHPGLKPKGLR